MGAGCSSEAADPGADLASAPKSWEGRRVLFLDIDGVLHPYACAIAKQFGKGSMSELARVVRQTGCTIVLSSAWRLGGGPLHTVAREFEKRSLPPVASTTPDFRSQGHSRVVEILAWLKRHPGVQTWAIVDDEELSAMQPEARSVEGQFVRTDRERGLDRAGAEALIQILSR